MPSNWSIDTGPQQQEAIPTLKQKAATTPVADRAAADVALYRARKRFNDLGC